MSIPFFLLISSMEHQECIGLLHGKISGCLGRNIYLSFSGVITHTPKGCSRMVDQVAEVMPAFPSSVIHRNAKTAS